uniref:Uncharacterized protein n=1 Tax=Pseudochlorodesmis sp. HV01306b TaxID=2358489 RepID=A0A386AYB4_9CHLO|nr:hypothetical protein [Pseudochlorodesmis sp. HV01306b]
MSLRHRTKQLKNPNRTHTRNDWEDHLNKQLKFTHPPNLELEPPKLRAPEPSVFPPLHSANGNKFSYIIELSEDSPQLGGGSGNSGGFGGWSHNGGGDNNGDDFSSSIHSAIYLLRVGLLFMFLVWA